MIEKEVVGAYFKVLSQNLPGELKKTKKNCSLGWEMDAESSKYEKG